MKITTVSNEIQRTFSLIEDAGVEIVLQHGLHKHGKSGDFYLVTGVSIEADNNSDNRTDAEVIYYNMFGRRFTRNVDEFYEKVPWPDGRVRLRFHPCYYDGELVDLVK